MPEEDAEAQENIESVLKSVPTLSDSLISDELECSVEMVKQVREEFDESINVTDLDFSISFSHPYSISTNQELLTTLNLEEGDVIQLTFESEDETNTAFGQIRLLPEDDNDWWEQELHAFSYGIYHCFEQIKEEYPGFFPEITAAANGRPDIGGYEELRMFAQGIQQVVKACASDDLLIGAGLIEIGTDDRHIDNLIETPLFKLEQPDFINFLQGDHPELVDWIPYTGEIDKPETVHFAYYGERFDDERYQRARGAILERSVYQADWNYTLPNFVTLVGPTAIGTSSPVIEVTDDNLEIIPGKQRDAIADGELGVGFKWFKDYVGDIGVTNLGGSESTIESVENADDEGEAPTVPHRSLDDQSTIIFLFDPVNLVLHIEDDRLVWRYPDDIGVLRQLVLRLTDDIGSRLDVDFNIQDALEPHQPSLPRAEEWVLDTNTFYHEIIENEPSSILHTIFPNDCFYDSSIHIPWIVPFEINKHPQRRSATEADVKQAKRNLDYLQFLENLGFFDLEIDSPPGEIQVDVGQADIADMHVVQYIDGDDQILITGDEDLQTISRLWDITCIGVSVFADVPDAPNPDQRLRDEILNKIGTEYEDESEILTAIKEQQSQQQTQDAQVEGSPTTTDEEQVLKQWRRQGEITRGPVESEEGTDSNDEEADETTESESGSDDSPLFRYGQANHVDVVPTPMAVEEIYTHWIKESDYLGYELLEDLKQKLDLSSEDLPVPTFHVPTQVVIEHADPDTPKPSEMNKKLYKLDSLENARYSSESLRTDDTEISTSITLAKENTWSVIAHPDEDYLRILGGALGVHVITLPSK